jgi:hypothetical protein
VGSSFTEFRERGFWSRNASIELWLVLLVREARQLEHPPSWLLEAAQDWYIQATVGMGGCVSARLDELAATPDQLGIILELSERALAWLKSQGDILSASFLNSFGVGGPGALFTKDMPTEVFSRIGENFIRLLRGEIVWDASTSPVF